MKYGEYTNKMYWLKLAFVVVLFVALTPGVLLRLPPGGSKLTVAAVHGVVFALVYHFTHHAAYAMLGAGREGVDKTLHCPEGQHKKDGKCVEN
jgi:hypothetical protein